MPSGVACKNPPATRTKASSSAQPAPVVNLSTLPGPAPLHRDGSRLNLDDPVAKGFARMGWIDPIEKWGSHISRELRAYALPFVNMQEYSCSKPEWHLRWTATCPLMSWLLALEEHSFYIFAVKVLAALCIKISSRFSSPDRELLLVMAQVCHGDLFDELARVKVFRFPDAKSIHVAAVIDHVRSILRLRVPLPDGFPFHRAPCWVTVPEDGLDPVIFKL